jgi:hypothetical protein
MPVLHATKTSDGDERWVSALEDAPGWCELEHYAIVALDAGGEHRWTAKHPTNKLIVVDQQPHFLPANLGIEPRCMRPVHTHDEDSVVHIEGPADVQYTVGDLWEVWGNYTHTLERASEGWRCSGMTFVVTYARGNETARDYLPVQQ